MRSESATINGRPLLRPRAVFLFRHTSRLGGALRGDAFFHGEETLVNNRKERRDKMDRKMTIANAAAKRTACVEFLSGKYKAEGYEVQVVPIEENGSQGVLLQMRNTVENTAGGWLKKLSGLENCATVKLVDAGTALSAEVLAGKWLDKIAAGAVSMVVLWPLFVTASIGAIKQKAMLDNVWNETVKFLSENACSKAVPCTREDNKIN